jgi:catechol 2,3-dioxygenase-like lactoylglutathione lyase family enzyme
MIATLEHVNLTVSDPAKTAAWMQRLFGWHTRWEGPSLDGGRSLHVGSDDQYLALYKPAKATDSKGNSYTTRGGLNHIAVVVTDIDAMEAAVIGEGFKPENHADYEPGKRFYFHDADGIEFEIVQYD